jgi:hypothetical protein
MDVAVPPPHAKRALLALAGAIVIAIAFRLAAYLAAESWTGGAVGSWLVIALPGLALIARSTGLFRPVWLTPFLPFALMLLGLDVTDSSRPGVVLAGYVLALLAGVVAVAAALVVHRRTRSTA